MYKTVKRLEEVIQTLINENSSLLKILNEVNALIATEKKFEGCTTIGGVKAIIKEIRDQKEKIFLLECEVKRLKNK